MRIFTADRLVSASLVALTACATAHLPPGNELEDPSTDRPERAGGFDKAPADEAELSNAFEAQTPAKAPDSGAAVQAPSSTPPPLTEPEASAKASPPAPPRELTAESRANFTAKVAAAKKKIAAGATAEAEPMVEEVAWLASELGPLERQESAELSHRFAVAQKDPAAERKACDRWLLSCGPERPDACRAAALGALAGLARSKSPEAGAARERHAQLTTADTCLLKAEAAARAKSPVPACLEAATGTYKRSGDRLMVARTRLAKALSIAGDPKKAPEVMAQLQRIETDCDEGRCAALRRRALRHLSNYYFKAGDLEGGAKAMLSEMAVGALLLPLEKRPYARTAEVERACGALDGKQGAGTCRRLEKAVLGSYTFIDFSRDKAPRGLTAEKVRSINEHYGPILQECLAAQAERLTPPAAEKYELRWRVTNDGRVDQLHLGKKDQESGPLADCLRRQFAIWRYPRYEGEAQHVEQVFVVTRTERKDGGALRAP